MLDNWQRIEQIIKWTGFASVSAFAREIGLNRSENLYQIKRGNNGISRDLSEIITTRFPEISRAWLLTGEGAMLKGDAQYRSCDIPFFKTDAVQVAPAIEQAQGDRVPNADHYISFPVFEGCDFAAFTGSGAMEPEVMRGSILFFQKVSPEAAVPGEMYLVLSPRFSGIRYLRRSAAGSGELRLVPANKKDFDEVVLDAADIRSLYLVRGVVTEKGL
jgi:hypothetical protein